METNWLVQGANGILAIMLAASVLTGAVISLVMIFSAGPHREPFWLAAVIAAGSGATITTVAHVLNEASVLSIWQVMVLGAGCGALGVLGFSLIVTSQRNSASSPRSSGMQYRTRCQSLRQPWRQPRNSCRAGFATPDFRQKRKPSACGQEVVR